MGEGVERSCETYEFPGWFCRLFYYFLASEERVPKQLKQVSIVGRNGIHTLYSIQYSLRGGNKITNGDRQKLKGREKIKKGELHKWRGSKMIQRGIKYKKNIT